MRAQIVVEVLVILSIVAMLSILILKVAKTTDNSNIVDEERLDAMQIADNVALQINTVYLSGNGAKANIKLPETIGNNKDYNLSLSSKDHIVKVSWDNDVYTTPVIIENVSILFYDKDLTIKNYGGKIVIT